MAKSVWEEATPEAQRGLQGIKQHVGGTVGKRTGPGSPGYIAQRGLAPQRQASVGRRLAAQMQMDLNANNRQMQMDLQQNRFAQEDKTFTRKLEAGVLGRRSTGSRSSGVRGIADDAWKYGGKDAFGLPTHRTNASGMQIFTPEATDKKTGVTTPGRFGETIGGAGMPVASAEGTGIVTDRPGSQDYSQNIFQRKEQRPDGSDRFVFTNIGAPNVSLGDREITDAAGSYDRELMNLPWREGTADKQIKADTQRESDIFAAGQSAPVPTESTSLGEDPVQPTEIARQPWMGTAPKTTPRNDIYSNPSLTSAQDVGTNFWKGLGLTAAQDLDRSPIGSLQRGISGAVTGGVNKLKELRDLSTNYSTRQIQRDRAQALPPDKYANFTGGEDTTSSALTASMVKDVQAAGSEEEAMKLLSQTTSKLAQQKIMQYINEAYGDLGNRSGDLSRNLDNMAFPMFPPR